MLQKHRMYYLRIEENKKISLGGFFRILNEATIIASAPEKTKENTSLISLIHKWYLIREFSITEETSIIKIGPYDRQFVFA